MLSIWKTIRGSLISGFIAFILGAAYLAFKDRNADWDYRRTVLQRVNQMERMQDEIVDFLKFIEQQERLAKEWDEKLQKLMTDHEKLEQVVSIDKHQAEVLIAYYREEDAKDDMFYLSLGILFPLILQGVWIVGKWIWRRRQVSH